MSILSQEQQDAIAARVDTKVTEAVNRIIAEEEGQNPDILISVPRSVKVQQKRPAASSLGHKGTTRPVTKAEQEAVAAASGRAAGGRRN